MADYKNLTDDQLLFIREAEMENLTVEYDYNGPFMEQATCPAVRIASLKDFKTNAKGAQWTQDGVYYVVYCPATYW